jgi:ribonuclease Z
VLYHEATFDKSKTGLAVMTGHSTTLHAAAVAAEAHISTLIIGHFSARYRQIDDLLKEARAVFPETYTAIDGMTYEIGNILP